MGQYNKAILTVAGENLIARTLAGEIQLNIAKAKTSNYIYPVGTDFKSLTDMQGIKQTATDPATAVYDDTMIQTRVLFSNEAIESTYYIHNIGLYAIDGTEEVLFCIVTAETPDEMPQYNGVASTSYIYNIQNVVQDAAELNITINPSGTATIQDVLERVDATGGDISETVIETLDTIEDKYPVPAAGESVKRFFGKVLTFLRNIRPLTSDLTLYVSAGTGSDTTGNGNELNPYASITKALSVIPKNLGNRTATIFIADGTYDEDVTISAFHSGILDVKSLSNPVVLNTLCKVKKIIITNCESGVQLHGLYFTEVADSALSVTSCNMVYMEYCQAIESATSFHAFNFTYSTARLSKCKCMNHKSCVNAYLADVRSENWADSSSTEWGVVVNGGKLSKAGNQPYGTNGPELIQNGGVLVNTYGARIGTLSNDVTLYVATIGSDTTGDGSQAKPFKSIQHAIDSLPKDLNGYTAGVNVAVGTYPEDVIITSFHGGTVRLESDNKNTLLNTCHVKSIAIIRCGTGYTHLNGFDVTTISGDAIQVLGSYNVHINYCQSTVTDLSHVGIQISESFCNINNCKVANRYAAASFSNSNGTSAFWNSGSTGNNIGLAHTNGSMVFSVGDQPVGTIIRFQGNAGAVFYENGTQIRNITSTGLSCTWGTISGGYVRHGNMVGTAMVTISLEVATTSTLSQGVDYVINGVPLPIGVSVVVSHNYATQIGDCFIDGYTTHIRIKPQSSIAIGTHILFAATYLTNS